ncbi:hypothetical protein FIBSPDRAFT_951176 [Athelia psychrophila]|uniref:Carbamoyl phosphate synthase ATP-binding domain-containing protein n=1 Tax=Athelia psychrophila TaxID=1759441 RepID=A0A166MWY3_9AGAM|nr:hypothetical protein FIBSPDRAFT_951176 [Fibularhizoctonia sp. CBS 109695]
MAPLTTFHHPKELDEPVLAASTKMARALRYQDAGTFQHLVNSNTDGWVFFEINTRIQVEHTVPEELVDFDIMRIQLLLSSVTLASLGLRPHPSPHKYPISLRHAIAPHCRRPRQGLPSLRRHHPCPAPTCGPWDMECVPIRGSAIVLLGRDIGEGGACPAGEKSGDEEEEEEDDVKTNRAVFMGLVAHAN